MQFSCPCCSRTLNVYPAHRPVLNLTKTFVEEAFESYNDIEGLDYAENGYVDQSLAVEDSNAFDDTVGPMIDSTEQTVKCLCGSEYVLSFPVMLTGVKLTIASARNMFHSDLQESLDIYDRHTRIAFENDTNPSTQWHGASVQGCVHNYIFQRRISGTNEAEVKCSKCNNVKRM